MFFDLHTLYILGHIVGVAIGFGGAFLSDLIFLTAARDGKISADEMRFIRLGSAAVWLGLLILVISGSLLFQSNEARYLASSKFAVKMLVVAVIFINGLVFHFFHIPRIARSVNTPLRSATELVRYLPWLMVSGAVSVVSWFTALLLGVLHHLPFTFFEILSVYLTLVAVVVFISLILRKKIIPLQ
jgi:hypothetical protein